MCSRRIGVAAAIILSQNLLQGIFREAERNKETESEKEKERERGNE